MATESTLISRREQASALLHSIRRRLLHELKQPESAASLARRLGTSRQRIRYHLAELERAGLVQVVAERRVGNCTERVVQAIASHFVLAPEVLGDLAGSERPAPRATNAPGADIELSFATAEQRDAFIRTLRERLAAWSSSVAAPRGSEARYPLRITAVPVLPQPLSDDSQPNHAQAQADGGERDA